MFPKNTLQSSHFSPGNHLSMRLSRGVFHYKLLVASLLAAGALGVGSSNMTCIYLLSGSTLEAKVQERNDRLNHTFSIDELSQESLIRELTVTTLYDYSPILDRIPKTEGRTSKIGEKVSSAISSLRRTPQTGGVMLRTGDMPSIDTLRESVGFIRSENPSALVVIDFEGGYVRAPRIPEEDLYRFNFPSDILDIAREERVGSGSPDTFGQFPSAEFLGAKYNSIQDEKKKKQFLLMIQQYGESIGRAFSSYGVHMILGPVLDTTDATIGTNHETSPIAKNDRAYSGNPQVVSELGNAFIQGLIRVPGITAVPKHFIGGGLTSANTDRERGGDTKIRGGAIAPFRDYVNLFEIGQLTPQQALDKLRSLQS